MRSEEFDPIYNLFRPLNINTILQQITQPENYAQIQQLFKESELQPQLLEPIFSALISTNASWADIEAIFDGVTKVKEDRNHDQYEKIILMFIHFLDVQANQNAGDIQSLHKIAKLIYEAHKFMDAKLRTAERKLVDASKAVAAIVKIVGDKNGAPQSALPANKKLKFDLEIEQSQLVNKKKLDGRLGQLKQSLSQAEVANDQKEIKRLEDEINGIQRRPDYIVAKKLEEKQQVDLALEQAKKEQQAAKHYLSPRTECIKQLHEIRDGCKSLPTINNTVSEAKIELTVHEITDDLAATIISNSSSSSLQQPQPKDEEGEDELTDHINFYYLQCLEAECITLEGTINTPMFEAQVKPAQQSIVFTKLTHREQEQRKDSFYKMGKAFIQTMRSDSKLQEQCVQEAVDQFKRGDLYAGLVYLQQQSIKENGTIDFDLYKVARLFQEETKLDDFDLFQSQQTEIKRHDEMEISSKDKEKNKDNQKAYDLCVDEWKKIRYLNQLMMAQQKTQQNFHSQLALALVETAQIEVAQDNKDLDKINSYVQGVAEQLKRSRSLDGFELLQKKYFFKKDQTINIDFYRMTKPVWDLLFENKITFSAEQQLRLNKMGHEMRVAFIKASSTSKDAAYCCEQAISWFGFSSSLFDDLQFVQNQWLRLNSFQRVDMNQYKVVKSLIAKLSRLDLTTTQQKQQQHACYQLGLVLVNQLKFTPRMDIYRDEAIVQLGLSNSFAALRFIHNECLKGNSGNLELLFPIAESLQKIFTLPEDASEQKSASDTQRQALSKMHLELGVAWLVKRNKIPAQNTAEVKQAFENAKRQLEQANTPRQVLNYLQQYCIIFPREFIDIDIFKFIIIDLDIFKFIKGLELKFSLNSEVLITSEMFRALVRAWCNTIHRQVYPDDTLFCFKEAIEHLSQAGQEYNIQKRDLQQKLELYLKQQIQRLFDILHENPDGVRVAPLSLDAVRQCFTQVVAIIHDGRAALNGSYDGIIALQGLAILPNGHISLAILDMVREFIQNQIVLEHLNSTEQTAQKACFRKLATAALDTMKEMKDPSDAEEEAYFLAAKDQFVRGNDFNGYISLQKLCLQNDATIHFARFANIVDLQQEILKNTRDRRILADQSKTMFCLGMAWLNTVKNNIHDKDLVKRGIDEAYQQFISAESAQGLTAILKLCMINRNEIDSGYSVVNLELFELIKHIPAQIEKDKKEVDLSQNLLIDSYQNLGFALLNTIKEDKSKAAYLLHEAFFRCFIFTQETFLDGFERILNVYIVAVEDEKPIIDLELYKIIKLIFTQIAHDDQKSLDEYDFTSNIVRTAKSSIAHARVIIGTALTNTAQQSWRQVKYDLNNAAQYRVQVQYCLDEAYLQFSEARSVDGVCYLQSICISQANAADALGNVIDLGLYTLLKRIQNIFYYELFSPGNYLGMDESEFHFAQNEEATDEEIAKKNSSLLEFINIFCEMIEREPHNKAVFSQEIVRLFMFGDLEKNWQIFLKDDRKDYLRHKLEIASHVLIIMNISSLKKANLHYELGESLLFELNNACGGARKKPESPDIYTAAKFFYVEAEQQFLQARAGGHSEAALKLAQLYLYFSDIFFQDQTDVFSKNPNLYTGRQYLIEYNETYKKSVIERCRRIVNHNDSDFTVLRDIVVTNTFMIPTIAIDLPLRNIQFLEDEFAELNNLFKKLSPQGVPKTVSSVSSSGVVAMSFPSDSGLNTAAGIATLQTHSTNGGAVGQKKPYFSKPRVVTNSPSKFTFFVGNSKVSSNDQSSASTSSRKSRINAKKPMHKDKLNGHDMSERELTPITTKIGIMPLPPALTSSQNVTPATSSDSSINGLSNGT